MIEDECHVCEVCGGTIMQRVEVNRFYKGTLLSRHVRPWFLFVCVGCGFKTKVHGPNSKELDRYLSAQVKKEGTE